MVSFFSKRPRQTTPSVTVSGEEIWFLDPDRTWLSEADLYEGSRRQLRYAGVIDVHVLFHLALCVELARLWRYSAREVAHIACHDLHEAVLGEWHKGLKEAVPALAALEGPWEAKIHSMLGLAWPVPPVMARRLKAVDNRTVLLEMLQWGHPRTSVKVAEVGEPTREEMDILHRLAGLTDPELWQIVTAAIEDYGGRQVTWLDAPARHGRWWHAAGREARICDVHAHPSGFYVDLDTGGGVDVTLLGGKWTWDCGVAPELPVHCY